MLILVLMVVDPKRGHREEKARVDRAVVGVAAVDFALVCRQVRAHEAHPGVVHIRAHCHAALVALRRPGPHLHIVSWLFRVLVLYTLLVSCVLLMFLSVLIDYSNSPTIVILQEC